MKCLACGSREAEAAMSRCLRCGFPLIHTVGEGENPEAALEKMAEEYRRKKLGGCSFGLLTYRHEMREGRLVQCSVQEITFPWQASELEPGFAVRLAVGDKTSYSCSDEVPLLQSAVSGEE